MRTIAIEEHFITPMYKDKVGANEYRNFYLSSRSEQLGHDIYAQNMNIGDERLAYMDAAGISMQVLSFGSPGPQAFEADVAVPMSIDANDRLHALVQQHPTRYAGFAALPTDAPIVLEWGPTGVAVNNPLIPAAAWAIRRSADRVDRAALASLSTGSG